MAPGDFADQHLAEHLEAEERDVGGLRARLHEAGHWPMLHAYQQFFGIALGLAGPGADAAKARAAGVHRLGHHLERLHATGTLDGERERRARMRAHRVHEGFPVVDRRAVERDDAIAAHEPGLLRGATGDHLPEHRRQRRPIKPQADALEHIGLDLVRREPAQVERHRGEMATLVLGVELDRLALQRRLQDAPAQLLPGADRLAVDTAHGVARVYASGRRDGSGGRRAEDRARFRQPVHEEPGVHQHREGEVEEWPRDDDGEALPDALAIECARELRGQHRPFALVEHLHVAAKGNGRDDPLGAVGAEAPEGERAAKTDREAQHLHAAPARDDEVAELVHHDQHAERDDEGEDRLHEAHAALASTQAAATRRPCSSAAITAERSSAGAPATASSVSLMTRAMLVNGSRAARKASTATLLAALSTAGAVPPRSSAL